MRGFFGSAALLAAVFFFGSPLAASPTEAPRVAHCFVALCDNVHQGIVPVPSRLGNGDDPGHNLYWGASFGVKTFFRRSADWKLLATTHPGDPVLERCVFKNSRKNDFLVADAYRGKSIKRAIVDFLKAASGRSRETVTCRSGGKSFDLKIGGEAQLLAYVGHDGLMDFSIPSPPVGAKSGDREAIILACVSRVFFFDAMKKSGAEPILWTTGLMAPEAYTLEAALQGWAERESAESIRRRAAAAYARYQKCSLKSAKRLLVSGFPKTAELVSPAGVHAEFLVKPSAEAKQ